MQDTLHEAVFQPYIAVSGKPITEDTHAKISAQVKANTVLWHVVDVNSSDLLQGCSEGAFEKLDWAKIGNRNDIIGSA